MRNHDQRLNARIDLPNGKCGGLRILIVEDDFISANSMAMFLTHYGHCVQIVSDGTSAYEAALSISPDVVLLDVALPSLDGWEVARGLQERSPGKIPFLIALTGYAREEDRRRSLDSGIDLHLVKPVDPNFLLQVLEKLAE